MKRLIIGTAGHVDHGKTRLVQALTGVDTDRLAEEKRRGLTIELGFAPLSLGDGVEAGLVDVPGHERFIRNMLAGAGGVDLALLVIAADEGVMPQTREHVEILELLGVNSGLIAVSKRDLVSEAELRQVAADIRRELAGSFLAGCPLLAVSSITGQGLDELRQALQELAAALPDKDESSPFRLPLDRVFTVEGFGTVVTGTLLRGTVNRGDPACLLPSGTEARVRNLQVHGREVERARAGQRVAVNLAGVKKDEVERGHTLAAPASLGVTRLIDVRLHDLPSSGREIANNSRLHFHQGTGRTLARAVLLDRDRLRPGESCFAQLHLETPLALAAGDRFVVRFFSPQETIGGGQVLDAAPPRHKRNRPEVLRTLELRQQGDPLVLLRLTLEQAGGAALEESRLAAVVGRSPRQTGEWLAQLAAAGDAVRLPDGRWLAVAGERAARERCRELLADYHRSHPLHAAMNRAELKQKLCPADGALADWLLERMLAQGWLAEREGRLARPDFRPRPTPQQSALAESLLEQCRRGGFMPPDREALLAALPPGQRAAGRQAVDGLLAAGRLVMTPNRYLYHHELIEQAWELARPLLETAEGLSLAAYRDALGVSRKYALALLEYFDGQGRTRREGDRRRLAPDNASDKKGGV